MSLYFKLQQTIAELPETTQPLLFDQINSFQEKAEQAELAIPTLPELIQSWAKVWCCSRFVAEYCLRFPEELQQLIETGDLFSASQRQNYASRLASLHISDEPALMRELRRFRNREMVRIAWRDIAQWASLEETLYDLTELAECCVQFSLDYHYQAACKKFGTPMNSQGQAFNIVILGMGKLGAWELNFSSDIDLIFAFAEEGQLNDRKQTSYGEFFTRICRKIVKTLDEITADGFVFRTDIRLRPFGDSGPVIMTFDGLENYYLSQAREWERYAMIKARQIAGDFESGKTLEALIRPFVYRRYLDFGAFEELRTLKLKITHVLNRHDKRNNVKLGPGGIREIEFIGQAFQLIRGGQDQQLQERSIIKIISILGDMEILPSSDVTTILNGYRFLRLTENRIQQYQDKQTHDLPSNPDVQVILAYSMGFSDWESFLTELNKQRNQVHQVFEQVFSLTDSNSEDNWANQIWENQTDGTCIKLLKTSGYNDPDQALKQLQYFKNSRTVNKLTRKGHAVINKLLPLLIESLESIENKDQTLKRLLDLIEQVAGRNVYLALLTENPDALRQLITLSSASPWICQYLSQYPVLFDELLDTRSLYEPLEKEQLSNDIQKMLSNENDLEQIMIKLRQFKQLNVLRIAAADIMEVIEVTVVSDYLTYVAEVIIDTVIEKAWLLMTEKHGCPPGTHEQNRQFAVIGYGKFGGIELGYSSDLDMVFLYDYPESNAMTDGNKAISSAQFYTKLGQKVRHILDSRMLSGILYEVDMRLRPSGNSGLLVTQIFSYQNYLLSDAWTWEHQALVRARFISGDELLQAKFNKIRQETLCMHRDTANLKHEVSEMREKMYDSLAPKSTKEFDIKHSRGGIVDIEFLVQFMVLAYAADIPELAFFTDNLRLLEKLSNLSIINEQEREALVHCYCLYRDFGHHKVLQEQPTLTQQPDFGSYQQQIEAIWNKYIGQ